jgi:hypothetical protein
MTVGGVATDVGRYGGTPIPEQMPIPYEPGKGEPNLPTFENQNEPANPTKGATTSVSISPVSANINITSTPDTTTQATVAALQAVVAQANERIRILEGKSGEKTPPSQLIAAQQALA